MTCRRLALYVFWEKCGIVRDYVRYYLQSLQDVAETVICIANGGMESSSKDTLQKMGVEVLERENFGLDFAAWKAALHHCGWEVVQGYDELILCNCSCYGPVHPLQQLFDSMESQACDFWGITRHPAMPGVFLIPGDNRSEIINHLQSYFVVFRSPMLKSKKFCDWWDKLKPAANYQEEVGLHETKMTRDFERMGFISDSFVDFEKYKDFPDNASILLCNKLLKNEKVPFVKRRAMCFEQAQIDANCLGYFATETLAYLSECTPYDTDYIWQDLLATKKVSDIRRGLHLNYFLPSQHAFSKETKSDVALVIFVYYEDLTDQMIYYIKSMPPGSSIYILSAKADLLNLYADKMKQLREYQVEYRQTASRGRDISAYLIYAADVYEKHDFICCIHDKKSGPHLAIAGEEFSYYCLENTLASKDYVLNVVNTFENNPRIGLMVQPPLQFGPYRCLGNEMAANEAAMRELHKMLKLKCPFDDAPLAPFGSCFWVRGCAFKSMFNHTWEVDDFPSEPMPFDGTISHAIERSFSMAVQDSGYATAFLATAEYASIDYDRNHHALRQYTIAFQRNFGLCAHHHEYVQFINRELNNFSKTNGTGDIHSQSIVNSFIRKGLRMGACLYYLKKSLACGRRRKRYKAIIQQLKRVYNLYRSK